MSVASFYRKRDGYYGRTEPYKLRGIKKVPCARCGKPSAQQWTICANDNRHLGVCRKHDTELNTLVLEYFGFPNVRELLVKYERVLGA